MYRINIVNIVYNYIGFIVSIMLALISVYSAPTLSVEDKDGGIPVIGGVIYPSLGVKSYYDDNVLLQDDTGNVLQDDNGNDLRDKDGNVLRQDSKDSFVVVTSPRAKYYSEGDITLFTLDMGIDDGYYTHSHNDNYFDIDANTDISFYPTARLTFFGGAGYKKGHVARGQGNQSGLRALRFRHPDRYRLWNAKAGIKYGLEEVGMPRIETSYVHNERRYSNNLERTRFQERNTDNINTTLFYQILPNTSLLIEGGFARFSYQQGIVSGDLDSNQFSILGGLSWQATYQTEGYFKIGWNQKFFDAQQRDESAGISWAVGIDWKPLSYTKISFLTSQKLEEADGLGSDVNATSVELSWDHYWQDWFNTTVSLYYSNQDYTGSSINDINDVNDNSRDRMDDNFGVELSADYEFRRWLSVGVDYSYSVRSSSVSSSDYERNIIGLHALFSL